MEDDYPDPTPGESEPGGGDNGWTTERDVSEDGPAVGDRVTFGKPLTEMDVERFAAASGDTNRIHLDADFAEATRFGGRVVHGSLAAGLISAALARLPGLVIYLSQELSFVAPVPIDDEPTATVEVVEVLDGGRLRLSTTVHRGDGELAVEGQAVVLIDDPPTADGG
jgi:acyl dehydratase